MKNETPEAMSLVTFFETNTAQITKFFARVAISLEQAEAQVRSLQERIVALEVELSKAKGATTKAAKAKS